MTACIYMYTCILLKSSKYIEMAGYTRERFPIISIELE